MFYAAKIFFPHQKTPLDIAVERNHTDVVKYLKEKGVSS